MRAVRIAKLGGLPSCRYWAVVPFEGGAPIWRGHPIVSGGRKRDAVEFARAHGYAICH